MKTQEKEQHYFEMFRKDYPLPSGTIIYRDRPDVILDGTKKIGIEITNFYLEKGELLESEQRQKKLRDSIISDAQRIYQANNNDKTELTIEFDKAKPVRDANDVVAKLVALVEHIRECKTGRVACHLFQNIPEIASVYKYREETCAPRWRNVQAYSGSIMSRDKLISIVKDKEESSRQYQKCDSFWLLVVVDFMNPAQDQEIQIDDFNKIESNVFEKIIVYKTIFPHILEAK